MELLRDEFIDRLDESLILAILGDYELTDGSELANARAVLQDLARNAELEESRGFIRSESSKQTEQLGENASSVDTGETTSQEASASSITVSSHVSSLVLRQGRDSNAPGKRQSAAAPVVSTTQLFPESQVVSEDSLLEQLKAAFVQLKEHEIKMALRRARGDVEKAMDELLSVQMLEREGGRPKGIDAFFRPEDELPGISRGNSSNNRTAIAGCDSGLPKQGSNSSNKNHSADDYRDVVFLSQLLDQPFEEMKLAYLENGSDVALTALRILEKHAQDVNLVPDFDRIEELTTKYPNVPKPFIVTVVEITQPGEYGSRWTEELANILNKHFAKSHTRRMNLSYTLSPMPGGNDETSPATSSRAPTTRTKRQADGWRLSERPGADIATPGATTESSVSERSDRDSVDLHGYLVDEGVRLARARVKAWWDDLGENQARKARDKGFVVVTGRGKHNPGGYSRMRHCVHEALIADGWKLEIETGRYRVTGRL